MWAVDEGHLKIVKLLLDTVQIRITQAKPGFEIVTHSGVIGDAVKLLLEYGANPNK